MNYSQVMSQKADQKVQESVQSGQYDVIKDEAFNRDNSELLSKLEADVAKQRSQEQEQTQTNNQNQDQSQQNTQTM